MTTNEKFKSTVLDANAELFNLFVKTYSNFSLCSFFYLRQIKKFSQVSYMKYIENNKKVYKKN